MAPGTAETNVAEAVTGGAEEGENLSLSALENCMITMSTPVCVGQITILQFFSYRFGSFLETIL